ncbi:polysaccharide biosynthesis/export family protein [Flavobacteriaceae bacterium]|nr:polysaccharide biosynthesis/export family protein [Flavobacteriaceae bacterium]
MYKHFIKFKLLIFISLILGSCVSKKNILYLQDINSIDITEVSSSKYILQENDILKIDITSLENKASLPFNKVSSSGALGNNIAMMQLDGYLVSVNKTINFPVLGEISVLNKTIFELESDIKNRLIKGGYLIKPNVSIRLLNSKFTILGEVNKPGTYTFTEKNISLLQALGLAGDLTIDGNRKDIIVIRELEGKRITTYLDLTSASLLTSFYQNVQPNDVIIVNPNSKKVRSAGLVGNISAVLSIASILLSTIILIR